jgi:peptidoglycan/LPS O-acetylase OafA/YrhL/lysophospholipase L1-like esterase
VTKTEFGYRPDIDGMRAIAVLMVLAVHAFPARVPNGFVGVDIFFVISGYLITSILLRELSAHAFSIRNFYVRRINRIFPALAVVLLFCLATGPFVMYPSEYAQMGKSAMASALFVANINFYLETGYWDINSKLKPLLHIWSLGVEEQFYLLWPLILWGVARAKKSAVSVSLAVIFATLCVNLVWTFQNQPAAFYLPLGRFWELACGGLLACIQRDGQVAQGRDGTFGSSGGARQVLGIGGLTLLAVTQVVPLQVDAFPGFYAVVVVGAATLLVLAGPQAWVNRRLLAHPVMVYMGKISYPLYLWHWPLLVFARLLGDGQWSHSHRNLALAGSMVMAVLTHHAVERPLAGVSRRNVLALALAALMAVVGALSGLAYMGRLPVAQAYPNAPLQTYDKPVVRSQGKIILLGDSNAGHFSYGLSLLYGERLTTIATPGWPYLDGVRYREGYVPHREHQGSPALTEDALRRIETDDAVRLVILSNAHLMYLPSDNLRSVGGSSGETVAQAYEAGMRRTLERLRRSGKAVVLVKAVPTYPMLSAVTACTTDVRPVLRRQPADCQRARVTVDAERAGYDALITRVLQGLEGVRVFDTLEELCDAQYCYVSRDGIQMYIDSGHFTTAGSQLMGAALARQVEAALSP